MTAEFNPDQLAELRQKLEALKGRCTPDQRRYGLGLLDNRLYRVKGPGGLSWGESAALGVEPDGRHYTVARPGAGE